MQNKSSWDQLASDESIEKVISALKPNNIEAVVVNSGAEAKEMVLEMLPEGAEVMTMSSETLRTTGIADAINEPGKFDSVKNKLNSMDRTKDSLQMQKLGSAPEWAVGSAHAVTEDGKVLIASNTGSQLPAYAYGSQHVIWVVGAQKIVANLDTAMKRLYDYVLPLESERLKNLYGVPSNVSKELIISREVVKGRITMIIVKEPLGF